MNCQTTTCPNDTSPLIGSDAESPPASRYVGLGFGSVVPPPLNFEFDNPTCFAVAYSLASQADADAQAQAASVACANVSADTPLPWYLQTPSNIFDGLVGSMDTPPLE